MNSVLTDTINSIRKDLAQQEARYNQSVTMPIIIDDDDEDDSDKEVNKEIETIDHSNPIIDEDTNDIEILEGEEKESVLEDSYEGMDDKIVLKMRSESDEENVVVIRMAKVFKMESKLMNRIVLSRNESII